MATDKRKKYVFILKLWSEKSENALFVWRGSLADIESEKKSPTYFQGLRGLVDLLSRIIGNFD